ncbi:lipoprotein [Lentzea sp. NBRC 105346]|uniref:hypothetical protein n=1 Tax=Lentzea sp. NBRC 105346 TaxID=3032205 RepID=UPI0024A1CC57|nr:hypothetical protein [Lentzea sp. NBRC 105346]GLZ31858.1 lipoprotein [Lentzea sp. NBRC 105346]
MKLTRILVAATAAAALSVPSTAIAAPAVDPGVTAAYAVYDRNTGHMKLSSNEHMKIRSASIVKILIALDYLEKRGPGATIPQADLDRLVPMLRSSDDNAASSLWVQEGWEKIIQRMIVLIGLEDTEPPANVGFWGYTAVSASDIVKIYRYIQERANPSFHNFIMTNLHYATKCATDGFDQSFGIPSAVPGYPGWKQGWSRFGDTPPRPCAQAQAKDPFIGAAKEGPVEPGIASASDIDLTSPAMHTSGVYSRWDRKIMVVLTLQPAGTTWDVAAERVTRLTGELYAAELGS